jgi:alkanesulfonate monooxygenase SsuD/methylene tetrahydromethanopterin reductase-like flavin-dependent oxidoreductase (luciferase family)
MTDYGHDLQFGTFLTPAAQSAAAVVELAQVTDRAGLEHLTIQDHPYQPAFLDTWTLLSVIAARTEHVRVSPAVANLPLRPPAVLARAAASLDILSGGRAELGLGSGSFWDAIVGMGGPRRNPGEAVEALEEAIKIIRALWTPGPGVRFEGQHYQLHGAKPGPFPVHDIGIWIGSYKPRMLRLTGRLSDGWMPSAPYLPPDGLAEANKIIDEAALAAGRSPSAVRRFYNMIGGDGFPRGPVRVWPEQLAELTITQGMSGYIFGANAADQIERFAAEVVPATRELVAVERAGNQA